MPDVFVDADLDKPLARGWDVLIFKNAAGERGVQAHIAKCNAWVAQQPPTYRERYCEHGRYVGFEGALDHFCPRCPVRV